MSIEPSNMPTEPVERPAEAPSDALPSDARPSDAEPADREAAEAAEAEAGDEQAIAGPPRPGFWEKMRRRKRKFIGKIVANLVGENPPAAADDSDPTIARPRGIRDEIIESGLWAGIANRVKRTADDYIAEKLDEIEKRIDKKLEEIDQRLSDWRDKEIANRLRIIKITLWASVIVAIISLIYAWLKVYFFD